LKIPSGERHELCRGVHAEQNVIIQAAVHGTSTKSATIYCTTYPCSICAKLIINAEISKVIYADDYEDELAKKIFEDTKIEVKKFKDN
jgi:dCMP deaminase